MLILLLNSKDRLSRSKALLDQFSTLHKSTNDQSLNSTFYLACLDFSITNKTLEIFIPEKKLTTILSKSNLQPEIKIITWLVCVKYLLNLSNFKFEKDIDNAIFEIYENIKMSSIAGFQILRSFINLVFNDKHREIDQKQVQEFIISYKNIIKDYQTLKRFNFEQLNDLSYSNLIEFGKNLVNQELTSQQFIPEIQNS